MFQGFGFAIPAAFITVLTVMAGFVFVLAGWGLVLFGPNRTPSEKIPPAVYTLTLSVLVQLAGPVVLYQLPDGFASTSVHGMPMAWVVWSCFLAANFFLCVTTWWLAKTASDSTTLLLRIGSTVLLIIWGVGAIWYLFGE
jgi:hypothetical protein